MATPALQGSVMSLEQLAQGQASAQASVSLPA